VAHDQLPALADAVELGASELVDDARLEPDGLAMPHGGRWVRRIDVNGATWYPSPRTPFRSYLRIPFEELLSKFELTANPSGRGSRGQQTRLLL
jgi:hypothetical protein